VPQRGARGRAGGAEPRIRAESAPQQRLERARATREPGGRPIDEIGGRGVEPHRAQVVPDRGATRSSATGACVGGVGQSQRSTGVGLGGVEARLRGDDFLSLARTEAGAEPERGAELVDDERAEERRRDHDKKMPIPIHRSREKIHSLCAMTTLTRFCRFGRRIAPLGVPVLLLGALGACASTPGSKAPETPGSATYDATPLLASLRDGSPAARATLERAAGVARLEDLPLYDLDLRVDLDRAAFKLQEDVYFTNRDDKPLDEIVLRIYANVGKRDPSAPLPITLRSGKCVAPIACDVKLEGKSVIVVRPRVALAKGEHLRVSLDLTGILDPIDTGRTNILAQGIEGMANMAGGEDTAADYGLLARGDGIASLGNFYPVVARRRDGAWDRVEGSTLGDIGPDDMSNVHARVEVPANAKVAVTGTITTEAPAAGGMKRVDVAAGMVRDFAVLVSRDFEVATKDVGGVTVRSWFLKADRAAGERVLDVAATALATFEKRFGPYPYKDLDVVEAALVGGAGGVEFGALVTVASMMYRPAKAGPNAGPLEKMMSEMLNGPSGGGLSAMTGTMLEFTTAHEVAHQWWHGIVGSDSRLHPYVDESLAQFSAILYLEDRYGAERAKKDGDLNARMNYQFMRMTGENDAAVDRPAGAMSKMAYGGLVYGKGPYFYEAARKEMGDAAFFEVTQAYVAKYRFGMAPPEGFVDVAAAKAPRIRPLAHHWFQETHGDDDLGQLDLAKVVGQMLGGVE
jgi:Peptidase family M1 domain